MYDEMSFQAITARTHLASKIKSLCEEKQARLTCENNGYHKCYTQMDVVCYGIERVSQGALSW
jgi:hypothetical protein